MSACLRTAEAFGIHHVHLVESLTDAQIQPDIAAGVLLLSSLWVLVCHLKAALITALLCSCCCDWQARRAGWTFSTTAIHSTASTRSHKDVDCSCPT